MTTNNNFDVIIIGGSYAGLSAAMTLGRSLRNTLIIDSGKPCNLQTPYSHNFLTQDGKTPKAISDLARQQVAEYQHVDFCDELAVSAVKTAGQFGVTVTTQSGSSFQSKKLIFATGVIDELPGIKGFADCWGISVIHCPYCHGFEFRTKKTGIMARGERAFHLASLVNNLTNDLTLLTNGPADLSSEQLTKLDRHNIRVVETEIAEIEHQNGHLRKVAFSDGQSMDFDAVYAAVPFKQHTEIPVSLGCELTEQGYIKVDPLQQTTVEGIYACGDNSTFMRSIAAAVASGNMAGAAVNKALTEEHF